MSCECTLSCNAALEPELDTRSRLVGSIIRENIQRALDAGIPLRRIPGADTYLVDVLETFHVPRQATQFSAVPLGRPEEDCPVYGSTTR